MKLTVHEFLTLDGVMQGPGAPGEDTSGGFERGGWQVPYTEDEDFGRIVGGWFEQVAEFLLGRSTYDMMYAYWSQVTDPGDIVAAKLNGLPKHIVSATLADAEWQNSVVIGGDVVGRVQELKKRPGGELQVHGSWQLVRTLHEAGLIDEYRLMVFPVVVGPGKRLFDAHSPASGFTLVDSAVTGSGAVYQVLRPTVFRAGRYLVEGGREVSEVG
ncbi:dihydrofolate reductase family protein [Nocardia speluncae]|uniref:Dihydrofolate reductase family protein n=1 Tax=Nocardia speluncae TaxID=419477 RepID=A0A846XPD2_9NOCA|nr:dihydrofolate reductase family protein [Nocardia speluncae]NKY35534.1 dihydrofolate reductase family protein [Nocardia speluncae]